MKAIIAVVLSSVTALCIAQGTQGYVVDGSGQIVKTGSGLCLRNGSYTSADAVTGCDPGAIPVQIITQRLGADVLFAFDSDVLTSQGKAALDKIVASMVPESSVSVVGHTDRIGTAKYNMKLSDRRAFAVSQYLDEDHNRKFAINEVMGVGSTQPAQDPALCATVKQKSKLIACLAVDRRVVITYTVVK